MSRVVGVGLEVGRVDHDTELDGHGAQHVRVGRGEAAGWRHRLHDLECVGKQHAGEALRWF